MYIFNQATRFEIESKLPVVRIVRIACMVRAELNVVRALQLRRGYGMATVSRID